MKRIAMAALLLAAGPRCAPAARLKPQGAAAFDRHVRQAEQRLDGRKSFLWAGEWRRPNAQDGGWVYTQSGPRSPK